MEFNKLKIIKYNKIDEIHYLKFVYLARVCSQHFHSSQFKDRSWLLGLLPNYSPVKSRKLKLDAIPMEFVEDNATTVVEKDLRTEVRECTHVATDCVASSSESFVISTLANEVTLSFTNEEASCSLTQVASSSETPDTPSSANPVASCSTSTSSDNFSSIQIPFNQDDIQKLIRENADLVRQNKILQNKVLQLDQINKLHEKEMKNINKGHEQ
ncbi:uncharacterized protein LOC120358565 [Solenopsis invicta]|uniref:uncharacterized protein LOC120358565 n=1 Tax=Solenopsis invicta TaxID=13686 RepID=UPI00193CC822|nr:uncharacterized protein LOC120358565 [Solenopsis invicta]